VKISKSLKIWAVSLVLLALTVQTMSWILPMSWFETFFMGLGAFWFGKLWGDVTTYIENR
jgi:hypothetical protein